MRAGVPEGVAQGRGPPDAEQQLVPAGVVDHQHAVLGQLLAQGGDQVAGEEGQVGGEDGDHLGRPDRGEPGGERGNRAATRRDLSDEHDALGDGLGRSDHDDRVGVPYGVQDGGEHGAATDVQLRLGLSAEPGCPAAGQHDGREGRERGHGRNGRAWAVSTVIGVGRVTSRTPVLRIRGAVHTRRPDTVASEEPLEIRLGGTPLAVTMRTPGDDFDLVHGFLTTEGVIASAADIAGLRYCNSVDDEGRNTYNVVDVDLAPGVEAPDTALDRNFYTTSSCGVCGKASIDAIRTKTAYDVAADDTRLTLATLLALPDRLRAAQQVFDKTGGLHAAGLFTAEGEMVALREDVGRHNAVDKVVGDAVREGRVPLAGHVLMVSGRSSFELTQKAAMAAVPVLAAVSAPSSLAVELAQEVGITLIGFLRGDGCNVYTHPERLVLE